MTAINNFYVEQTTIQTHTGDLNWTQKVVISGASLAANTDYLILAKALFGGDNIEGMFGIRVRCVDDATIETRSTAIIEPQRTPANELKAYFFPHSFSTDGIPGDVSIEIATLVNTTDTARADQISLELIDLDDYGSASYFEDVGTATGTEVGVGEGSATTIATLAAGDLGTTEEWLLLGYCRILMGSTTRSFGCRFRGADDAASVSTLGYHFAEGEVSAGSEFRVTGFAGRHKAVTSDVAASVEAWEEHAAANMDNYGGYIIALKASVVADFQHDYTVASIDINPLAVVASLTTTPVAGDYLVIGRANNAVVSGRTILAVRNDTPTYFLSGDEDIEQTQTWDSTDQESSVSMARENLAAISDTFEVVGLSNQASGEVEHRWLLMLSLEKAAAPPALILPRRRQETVVRM